MRISTRGRYGIRLMVDLALNENGRPVRVREMASRQDLSPKYVEQLLARLKAAGLVKAIHGARGGYVLARKPKGVRMAEVFEALEGAIAMVECLGNPRACRRQGVCATRELWARMSEAVADVLGSTTLGELAGRQKRKERVPALEREALVS